jgi:hypothetical protein
VQENCSVYGETGKRNTSKFSEFLSLHGITPTIPRRIGRKHASRIHGGTNPTPQHLDLLTRIALKQKIGRLDAGKNYVIYDTEKTLVLEFGSVV